MITVDAGDWHSHFTDLAVQGCTFFDFLTVVDRDGRLEVLARVMNPESKQAHLVSCYCGDSILQSLSDVYPGSVWHEREAAEMFGVSFTGLTDSRNLLLRAPLGPPPMLKDTVLVARVVREWPGSAASDDDGRQGGNPSRRRMLPPGVPDGFIQPSPAMDSP